MYQYEGRNGIVSMEELKNAKEITLNFNIVESELISNLSEEEIKKTVNMVLNKYGDEEAEALGLNNLPIDERNERLRKELEKEIKEREKLDSDIIVRDENIGEPFTIKLK